MKLSTEEFPVQTLPDGLPRRAETTALTILDEFSFLAFSPEMMVIPMGMESLDAQLTAPDLNLLLVESAWEGNFGLWRGHVTNRDASPTRLLKEAIGKCSRRGIPTVFWAKEDPPHFEQFLEAARLFDYVFTTDGDCVERYKRELGHDRVWPLPFACQPALHNPTQLPGGNHTRDVAFGGTWYGERFDGRKSQMTALLEPAISYGLHIFDRKFAENQSANFTWPPEYHASIVGGLPYAQMISAYKKYKIFMNVNSVTNSPTMFSRRVFELLACRTSVISAHSSGIAKLLPGMVTLVNNAEETRQALEQLLGDSALRDRQSHRAMRVVLSKHTYAARIGVILEKLGLSESAKPGKGTLVICLVNDLESLVHGIESFARQITLQKELCVIALEGSVDGNSVQAALERVEAGVFRVQYLDRMENLSLAVRDVLRNSQYRFWTVFHRSCYYGANFLFDSALPFSFTDASVVGKSSGYVLSTSDLKIQCPAPGREFSYRDDLEPGSLLFDASMLELVPPATSFNRFATAMLTACQANNVRTYSADKFNFCVLESQVGRATTGHAATANYTALPTISSLPGGFQAQVDV